MVYHTKSSEETVALGRALAAQLRPGDVVAFYGDLGAGKTTMIKGVCAGLGVADIVKSPSFVMITEYRGRIPVYHIDLYRLARAVEYPVSNVQRPVKDGGAQASDAELEGLGLDSYLEGDGLCLIEWAERAERMLPQNAIRVHMRVEGSGRRIEITGLRAQVQPRTP